MAGVTTRSVIGSAQALAGRLEDFSLRVQYHVEVAGATHELLLGRGAHRGRSATRTRRTTPPRCRHRRAPHPSVQQRRRHRCARSMPRGPPEQGVDGRAVRGADLARPVRSWPTRNPRWCARRRGPRSRTVASVNRSRSASRRNHRGGALRARRGGRGGEFEASQGWRGEPRRRGARAMSRWCHYRRRRGCTATCPVHEATISANPSARSGRARPWRGGPGPGRAPVLATRVRRARC